MSSRPDAVRVVFGLVFALIVGFGSLWLAEGRKLEPVRKQIVIVEVDNGYTIELKTERNPYPVGQRIARDPQGASAEVFAYLSGKPVKPNWREP